MLKRLTILTLLTLLTLSLAGAKTGVKSYTFTILSPTQAGAEQLKPGDYNIKVDGSAAMLTDKQGRQLNATITLQPADHKFDGTAVFTTTAEGVARIVSVQLGGSRNTAVFE